MNARSLVVGAAGLFVMQQNGQLDGIQTIVALTTITLFIPCIANFLVILKERGRKAGFAIRRRAHARRVRSSA